MHMAPGTRLGCWEPALSNSNRRLPASTRSRLSKPRANGQRRRNASPWVNHSWHVTLYVTATGLTTSLIPYDCRAFEIDFDFVDLRLNLRCTDGRSAALPLEAQSVAAFYERLVDEMRRLGLDVRIHARPNEVVDAIRFDRDEIHRAYDPL